LDNLSYIVAGYRVIDGQFECSLLAESGIIRHQAATPGRQHDQPSASIPQSFTAFAKQKDLLMPKRIRQQTNRTKYQSSCKIFSAIRMSVFADSRHMPFVERRERFDRELVEFMGYVSERQ
jgi:hypothetical protein